MRGHIDEDPADVIVGELVKDLLCAPLPTNEPRGAKEAEVMAYERLRELERLGDLPNRMRSIEANEEDPEARRVAEKPESFGEHIDFSAFWVGDAHVGSSPEGALGPSLGWIVDTSSPPSRCARGSASTWFCSRGSRMKRQGLPSASSQLMAMVEWPISKRSSRAFSPRLPTRRSSPPGWGRTCMFPSR